MKSLERRFNNIAEKNSNWSSYICFAEAIKERRFGKQAIHRWFNKLVDKDDYAKNEKKAVLGFLVGLSNPVRTTGNGVNQPHKAGKMPNDTQDALDASCHKNPLN